MKKLLISLFALMMTVGQTKAQVSFGHVEQLNTGWSFLRMDAAMNVDEQPNMKEKNFDDSRWRKVNLPHDWGVELPMSPDKGSCQGYLSGGVAWYRLHIPAGRLADGKRNFIYFEGVYNYSEVYLNGHLLGKRPSGFASFLYDMTPYIEQGENVLAVRVDHSQEFDSRWYTGSGIYRNVWLVTAPQVHLAQWGTAYRLKSIQAKNAELEVDVETADDRAVKSQQQLSAMVQLFDSEGKVVASTKTAIGLFVTRWMKPERLLHPMKTTILVKFARLVLFSKRVLIDSFLMRQLRFLKLFPMTHPLPLFRYPSDHCMELKPSLSVRN